MGLPEIAISSQGGGAVEKVRLHDEGLGGGITASLPWRGHVRCLLSSPGLGLAARQTGASSDPSRQTRPSPPSHVPICRQICRLQLLQHTLWGATEFHMLMDTSRFHHITPVVLWELHWVPSAGAGVDLHSPLWSGTRVTERPADWQRSSCWQRSECCLPPVTAAPPPPQLIRGLRVTWAGGEGRIHNFYYLHTSA